MLRYALRRIVWTFPVLVAVTLALFALLSLDRSADSHAASAPAASSLPAFINLRPRDVRALSSDAIDRLAANPDDTAAANLLVRLGGAALPFVLPQLESLGPDTRKRVASVLGPIATRMGIASADTFLDGDRAVEFWTMYWLERSVDFKPGVVRRAVRRLAIQGSEARRTELVELDTYALAELMDALGDVQQPADVARVSRLLDVASHVTARDDRIGPDATIVQARACAIRWREWWLASRADYELLSGPSRVAAMLVETRYGHWALRAFTLKLGIARDGQPVLDKLLMRAPRTLLLAFLGLVLAHGIGIAIGLVAAWRRRGWIQPISAALAIASLAIPAPVTVILAARATGGRLLIASAVVAIAVAFAGSPARHQRLAALDAMMREVVRYARARGLSDSRLLLHHTLRPALIAVLPLFALDFPLAVSCACAAEKALGLRGIGVPIVRAAIEHDLSFLMATGVGFTAIAALLLLATDVATTVIDRRTQRYLLQERV